MADQFEPGDLVEVTQSGTDYTGVRYRTGQTLTIARRDPTTQRSSYYYAKTARGREVRVPEKHLKMKNA